MTKKLIGFLIFAYLINSSVNAFSQSFFSSQGFGERIDDVNAQTISLGGAHIALPDGFQINSMNPAALTYISVSRLSGNFIHQNIWSESDAGTGFSKYSNFNGAAVAMPLKVNKFVVAAGLVPFSQFDYSFSNADSIDGYHYTKFIDAEGGLNKVHAGFGFSPIKQISAGVYFNYIFGKLTKKWRVDYVSDLFWDTSDNIIRKVWGASLSYGVLVNPWRSLYLGAFYAPKYELNYRDQVEFGTLKGTYFYKVSDYELSDKKMQMPEILGLGASYTFKQRFRLSTSYFQEPWSKFDISEVVANEMKDRYRISFGFEYLPSTNMLAKYHEKMTYRAGYFYQNLNYADDSGKDVTEFGLAVGFGLPYYQGKGRIDVALQYVKRGSLDLNFVQENIFQLNITVIAGEKWFVRRRQK